MSATLTVAVMPEQDARKLTERIRVTAVNYADARQKLQELVAEAKEGNAHLALGYSSWTAYLAEVLGEEPMRLARGERQEMVQMLSAEGMSTRAIAPIVGVGIGTVSRDRQTPVPNGTPAPAPVLSDAPGPITKITGPNSVSSPSITGMDGKNYTRPEPTPTPAPVEAPKPKRRPLPDQASEVGWDIRKATEKLQRIFEDDRIGRNKNEVAAHLRGHLMFTVEVCQDLLDQINQ